MISWLLPALVAELLLGAVAGGRGFPPSGEAGKGRFAPLTDPPEEARGTGGGGGPDSWKVAGLAGG